MIRYGLGRGGNGVDDAGTLQGIVEACGDSHVPKCPHLCYSNLLLTNLIRKVKCTIAAHIRLSSGGTRRDKTSYTVPRNLGNRNAMDPESGVQTAMHESTVDFPYRNLADKV